MKFTSTLALALLFISSNLFAQVKVVIMGSSTAYGVGATTYANSWAGKTEALFNQNTSDGQDTIFYNIAHPAYDTYQEMPSNFIPPPGRPLPDDSFNVTMALSYNPDIILISLPSNDINYGYSKHEMISNLRFMSSTILANGFTRCFVTTSQPRNDLDQDHRDSLLSLVDSINYAFGPYAIDFWNGLVTEDGLNMLKDEYRAAPSPVHINDAGHDLLFGKIRDAHIFGIGGPVALQLTGFKAKVQNNNVLFNWHIEQQGPNTSFELQRSADGHSFETIFIQSISEARQSSDYTATDHTPISGKSFYRIKIIEQTGRISYSAIISIISNGKSMSISKLYVDNAGSILNAEINIQKSQFVNINIITSAGAVLSTQKLLITQTGNYVRIPIGKLPAGQYFLKIISTEGEIITKPFIK